MTDRTPLDALHRGLGGRMVEFAGTWLPVHYPTGILKEHLHTRAAAGLFDVSHMGQIEVRAASGDVADAARALEALVPVDLLGLAPGRQRYALLTDDSGGILDDLMVANRGDHLLLVVNAARKAFDLEHLAAGLGSAARAEPLDRALLALQGPKAEAALATILPDVASMRFMEVRALDDRGTPLVVSRSGYTGEDGFEVALATDRAQEFAERLLRLPEVMPVGLGARDSLRLEAGLCLWGHDIDTGTTPVEAALEWAIQPARRPGGDRAGGFPGAATILGQIAEGATRRRVGLRPEGRAPMREGVEIETAAEESAGDGGDGAVGIITSGGFGPSLDAPVAMGYVPIALAAPGTRLHGRLRGKSMPATVTRMPFIAPGYKR
jgi:aminomethyltransferase